MNRSGSPWLPLPCPPNLTGPGRGIHEKVASTLCFRFYLSCQTILHFMMTHKDMNNTVKPLSSFLYVSKDVKITWISSGSMQDVWPPPTEHCSVGSELCTLHGNRLCHATEWRIHSVYTQSSGKTEWNSMGGAQTSHINAGLKASNFHTLKKCALRPHSHVRQWCAGGCGTVDLAAVQGTLFAKCSPTSILKWVTVVHGTHSF